MPKGLFELATLCRAWTASAPSNQAVYLLFFRPPHVWMSSSSLASREPPVLGLRRLRGKLRRKETLVGQARREEGGCPPTCHAVSLSGDAKLVAKPYALNNNHALQR
ncbi:hypothetical protein GQ53DRAFT_749988 [Thozetella sp. PMI_491]|nr:hypothetical protein GQ53DRAFT_749988 [Thozetella sp. PMI_491]